MQSFRTRLAFITRAGSVRYPEERASSPGASKQNYGACIHGNISYRAPVATYPNLERVAVFLRQQSLWCLNMKSYWWRCFNCSYLPSIQLGVVHCRDQAGREGKGDINNRYCTYTAHVLILRSWFLSLDLFLALGIDLQNVSDFFVQLGQLADFC